MPEPHPSYAPGDQVRVLDGPFADYQAYVQAVDAPRGRLEVAVTVAGRPVPIQVELRQVEKLG
jgi:transcriptional antiterminator NusG